MIKDEMLSRRRTSCLFTSCFWHSFKTNRLSLAVLGESLMETPTKTRQQFVKSNSFPFGSLLGRVWFWVQIKILPSIPCRRFALLGRGWFRVQIKVLPSIPCGRFLVFVPQFRWKCTDSLCFFVPESTNKTWLSDWSGFTESGTSSNVCERSIYPLWTVNSGRAPRDVSCSSKATIRRPI